MPEDRVCIHNAGTLEEAELVVGLLAEQGIKADIKDRGVSGVEYVRPAFHEGGLEVYVLDQETAARAEAILADYHKERRTDDDSMIELSCEACGQSVTFPVSQRGTVQECPHCHEYIDVPEAEGG